MFFHIIQVVYFNFFLVKFLCALKIQAFARLYIIYLFAHGGKAVRQRTHFARGRNIVTEHPRGSFFFFFSYHQAVKVVTCDGLATTGACREGIVSFLVLFHTLGGNSNDVMLRGVAEKIVDYFSVSF